jgi:uncharacterized membrane-anchored protein
MKSHRKFLLIGLFWVAIFAGFIGVKEFTLQTGREVFLKLRPVDPRDLFRGDYVVLNYEIGTIDLGKTGGNNLYFSKGEDIYVALDPAEKCAVPMAYYKAAPKEELFIKGKVRSVSQNGYILSVEYGIENYFVPEGKGREIERLRANELAVAASVDRFGTAIIKNLSIKGGECS